MVKNMGFIDIGYERWFITKMELQHGNFSDYAVMTIYLPRSINNPKVITKQISIHSNTVLWSIVENLQKKYPNASYWKTQRQREKLRKLRC